MTPGAAHPLTGPGPVVPADPPLTDATSLAPDAPGPPAHRLLIVARDRVLPGPLADERAVLEEAAEVGVVEVLAVAAEGEARLPPEGPVGARVRKPARKAVGNTMLRVDVTSAHAVAGRAPLSRRRVRTARPWLEGPPWPSTRTSRAARRA